MPSNPREQHIAAFSELIAAHRSRVFGYIYAMLHNMTDAEDVYQQTTLLMWEKFGEFQPGTDFGSWALKIAYYTIKNFQRTQSRKRVFFSEAVMEKVADSYRAIDERHANERMEALVACVQRLSSKQQQLLSMRYADGTSLKTIAQREGKSEAAMSMMFGRIRKLLFRCIKLRLAGT